MDFLAVFNIENVLVIIVIGLLLFLSGFFSGSETALTAASRSKLRAQADKGIKSAARALKLTANTEKLIGAILLGNNFANILAASLATHLFYFNLRRKWSSLRNLSNDFLNCSICGSNAKNICDR